MMTRRAASRAMPEGVPNMACGTDVAQVRHAPANQKPLEFVSVDPDENQRIVSSGKMSFAWWVA